MIVYLAGPMTGCTCGVMSEWREKAAKRLKQAGFRVLSPLRAGGVELVGARAEFYRDCHDIRNCDIVLVNLGDTSRVSIGTVMEMMQAYLQGKYIVAVLDDVHDHLFTREVTSYRAASLLLAVDHIVDSFGRV